MRYTILLIWSCYCWFSFAQQKPDSSILLVNGFVHVGNGQVIESAIIGIRSGKLTLVKNALAYTYKKEDWDTIIDLQGKQVYPGFVAPNCILGLTEIETIKASNDFHEMGSFNPHIRSQIAFNTESKVIATIKTNGVLLTQATPRGEVISGTSSVMFTQGWNWEDATAKMDDGVHVNWPQDYTRGRKNEQYDSIKHEIATFFEGAKAYSLATTPQQKDVRFEAMRACFTGTKRVYFHANHILQLLDIIDFAKQYNIAFPVIIGGYDSYLITQKLRDAKIPVMINRTHSLPEREDDPIDLPYQLAALLKAGGVQFCLQNEGDMEAMNARNIPFLAGTTRAYGLSNEEAIQAISLSACEIMGIAKQFGSIEEGKNATLFISTGDALEMKTNQVVLAFINGQFVQLTNSQLELYQKYQQKYKH